MAGIFITGTDTDVGKTMVSAVLIRYFASKRLSVAGLKPIASGFAQVETGEWQNKDVQRLKSVSNVVLPEDRVNRYRFQPAIAPHIAAQTEQVALEFELIAQDVAFALEKTQALVVEGVGGWCVPLDGYQQDYQDLAGLAKCLQLPVVLVVGMRLGCLNHAILTAQAIDNAGLSLLGWVANNVSEQVMPFYNQNLATLQKQISAPLLFEMPFVKEGDVDLNKLKICSQLDKFISESLKIC